MPFPPIAAGYRDCGLPKLVPIARWVLGQRLVLPSKPENKNPGAARGGEVKEERTRPRDHCPGIA